MNEKFAYVALIFSILCAHAFSTMIATIDAPIQARAVGATCIVLSGSDFGYNITAKLFAVVPITNIGVAQETCVNNQCEVRITFDPLPAALLGTTISAILSGDGGSTPETDIAVVVPPPRIDTSVDRIGTFTSLLTITGTGLGQNCTDVMYQPTSLQGNVKVSFNDSAITLTISSLDYSFIGKFINVSVSCNGVWSSFSTIGRVDYALVDTSSTILCSGDLQPHVVSINGNTLVHCVILINGNGRPVVGSDSNFLISDQTGGGILSPCSVVGNSTLEFTYETPDVSTTTLVQLTVLEATSRQDITNSPILLDINPSYNDRRKRGVIAGVSVGGAVLVVVVLVVVVRKMRNKRRQYQDL